MGVHGGAKTNRETRGKHFSFVGQALQPAKILDL